jgi:RNA ligase (TIGR02306 family)
MENLATIQIIKELRTHNGADTLDIATVLGWQIVTKRGEFQVGDKCVFITVDTVVPETPTFEFMRRVNFRVKPIRLRGEESAGLILPLSVLDHEPASDRLEGYVTADIWAEVGDDVTSHLGVKKYNKPIPPGLDGEMLGAMPGIIIQTDETNLRTWPSALDELYGRPFYITRKDDGTSGTFFIRGDEFGVCGRTIQYVESETNGFWRMARKYSIADSIRKQFSGRSIVLQGEVVGPGVQSNHLDLPEMEFHLFNIFDLTSRYYLPYEEIRQFCENTGIPMVPVISEGSAFPHNLAELIALANEQKYPGGRPAEGIVVRPKEPFYSTILKKAWSGKVLNTYYEEMMDKKKQDKREKRQQNAREAQSV